MKNILLFGLCQLTAICALAQTDSTLNQSMTLEREFSPTVRQSQKLYRQPESQTTKTDSRPDVEYADWEAMTVTSGWIRTAPAGQVVAQQKEARLGYVEASAGNYWNADIRAGIRHGDFAVDANGFFTQGKLDVPTDLPEMLTPGFGKWKSRYLNGAIKGTYSHTLDNEAQLEIHAAAAGHSLNSFNAAAETTHFGQISADASYETDRMKVRLGYHYNGTHLLNPDNSSASTTPASPNGTSGESTTRTIASSENVLFLKFSYGWYDLHSSWRARLDVDLAEAFAAKNHFSIQPSLHLSYLPDPDQWRRYFVDLGIGTRHDEIYDILTETPIVSHCHDYKSAFDVFRLGIGYEDNEQGQFRWGGKLLLGYTLDALCGQAIMNADDRMQLQGVNVRLFNDDSFSYGFEVKADYEMSRLFEAKAKVSYLGQSCDAARFARPSTQISCHLLSRPRHFVIDLGMDAALGRKMETAIPSFTSSTSETIYKTETVDLDAHPDLNLRVDWQANSRLKVYAFARNMLNLHSELWPGVPQQGINLHIGARYEF